MMNVDIYQYKLHDEKYKFAPDLINFMIEKNFQIVLKVFYILKIGCRQKMGNGF